MFVYIGYFYTLNEFRMIMHFRRRGRLMTSVVVPQAVLWICRGHLKNIHNYCKPGRKHPEYSSFIMSFYVFLIQMNFHTLQMFIILLSRLKGRFWYLQDMVCVFYTQFIRLLRCRDVCLHSGGPLLRLGDWRGVDHPDLESDGRKQRGKPIGKPLRFVEE